MRRQSLRNWGATLVLGLGTAATAWAGGEDGAKVPAAQEPPSSKRSWFGSWFGSGNAAEGVPEKAGTECQDEVEVDPNDVPSRTSSLASTAALRAREQATLLRRQAVCLRLKEIAQQTNDPELERLAETLDARAWRAYTRRTAHLPGTPEGPAGSESVHEGRAPEAVPARDPAPGRAAAGSQGPSEPRTVREE